MQEQATKTKRFNYIRGVNLSTARRIVKYEFRDFLIRVDQNDREHTYDIYLKEGVEQERIEYFQEYWETSYRIFITTEAKLNEKETDTY